VVNRLSPVITRLPADSSLSMKPPPWPLAEPSPNTVSICTALSLNISAPASAIAALARVQFDLDELHFLAVDAEVDLVGAALPAIARRRRRRRGAASPGTPSTSSAMIAHRQPVAHAVLPCQQRRIARGLRAGCVHVHRAKAVVAGGVVQVPLAHRELHRGAMRRSLRRDAITRNGAGSRA
jgi:hypothetical protein